MKQIAIKYLATIVILIGGMSFNTTFGTQNASTFKIKTLAMSDVCEPTIGRPCVCDDGEGCWANLVMCGCGKKPKKALPPIL